MHLLAKHNALEFPVSPSTAELFRNIEEFGAKKNFEDHPTGNTIQLLVLQKEIFLVYSFSEQAVEMGQFSRDYLMDKVTCLFAYR